MVGATAVGIVAEDEFAHAQVAIGELAGYRGFEDCLDARWGLCIGLAMAGVDVRMVVVDLASFLGWRDRTGKAADERALDPFASLAARPTRSLQLRPEEPFSRYWSRFQCGILEDGMDQLI